MKLPDTLNTIATAALVGLVVPAAIGLVTMRDAVIAQGVEMRVQSETLALIKHEQDIRAMKMAEISASQPGIRRDLGDVRDRVNWLTDAMVKIGHALDPKLVLPPPPPLKGGDQ